MKTSAEKFEKFVKVLFDKLGFEVKLLSLATNRGVDLEISSAEKLYGVEVKLYRTRRISTSIIKNSLIQLHYHLSNSNFAGGLLITTVNIEPGIRLELQNEFRIDIIERGLLFYLTKDDENLRTELENILLEISQSGEDDIYEGVFKVEEDYKLTLLDKKEFKTSEITKGKELCDQLKLIQAGNVDAEKFEKKCEEILRYLFASDLTNWNSQNRTVDTLHIFDLIAKISSTNDFWKSLSRDFNSRFVVFEFKNYAEQIKQGQIYTTEKYLYKTALRGIAFIISRKGADNNAITAMEGSLREYGKLIISLDENEICKLLSMKDNGDDPNTYLSEKVDTILMKLSR